MPGAWQWPDLVEPGAALASVKGAARRRRAGRPVGTFDLQIAAIGSARGVEAIATRNVADFEGCGVVVVNPWEHRT